MQRLDRPAFVNEPLRQPVEQFGMARKLSQQSEIFGALHQPLAEMPAPDAVDKHPCRQGMAGIDEPLGKLPAPALFST